MRKIKDKAGAFGSLLFSENSENGGAKGSDPFEEIMKLKTKLVIAFMTLMILSTLFTTVAVHTFAPGDWGVSAALSAGCLFDGCAVDLLDLQDGVCSAGEAAAGGEEY